ncbi:RICIN domain-containing protein [Corallococcus sp. M7]
MKRSMMLLLGIGALCLLAPDGVEARLLKNAQADYCMGVDHASKKDDAAVKLFRCDDKPNQQWTSKPVAEGVFNIVNGKSDKCMGVDHARTTPGADIKQFECDGSENQKWRFDTCGGAPCTVNVKSNLCLAAQRLGHDVQVEQLQCDGGTTQAWSHD